MNNDNLNNIDTNVVVEENNNTTVPVENPAPAIPTPDVKIEENKTDNQPDDNNGGKKSGVLLILLFIFFIAFVLLLPNISDMLKNGRGYVDNSEIENGVLTCDMEKENDTTTTIYEYTLNFTKKKLTTSTYNITVESEDKKVINQKAEECLLISDIAKGINGIDVTCTSSDNIATMIDGYNHKIIDTGKLTQFTEAGGIYPEFKYNDNIYNIKSSLIKAGYDCKMKSR